MRVSNMTKTTARQKFCLRVTVVVIFIATLQLYFKSTLLANATCGGSKPNLVIAHQEIPQIIGTPSAKGRSLTTSSSNKPLYMLPIPKPKERVYQRHPKLCFVGALRDLDELVRVFTQLFRMGEHLKRAVVMPPYLTHLYDPLLMHTTNRGLLSRNQRYCDPLYMTPNVRYWKDKKKVEFKQWPEELETKQDKIVFVSGTELEAHASTLFESNEQEHAITRAVFSILFPYKETRNTVENFVARHFGTEPFVAVHLELCEDAQRNDHASKDGVSKDDVSNYDELCAQTDPALFQHVLQKHAPQFKRAQVFVSATINFQKKHPNVMEQFEHSGAVMFEDMSLCLRQFECDVVMREIASYSSFFYSAIHTPAVQFMENLRQYRNHTGRFIDYVNKDDVSISDRVSKDHDYVSKGRPLPALFQNFNVFELRKEGWKFDEQLLTLSSSHSRSNAPTPPTQHLQEEQKQEKEEKEESHYQKYLVKLERQRPFIPREMKFPPNGVLCQLGSYGQLNNILDSVAGLMYVGLQLSRTVVIPPLVSQIYDVNYLERFHPFEMMKSPDGHMYQPSRVTTNQSLCDTQYGWGFETVFAKQPAKEFTRVLNKKPNKPPVMVMSARDTFQFGVGKRKVFTNLFKYLYPHKETRDLVVNFVENNFGDKPFVAVHLRFLDGHCYERSFGDLACDADPILLRQILKVHAPELVDAPVFVASDHQRPDLELLFAQAGAIFYRGSCHSYDKQCMVIDAEIAARSSYFYGLQASTAARTIEHLRTKRDNGTPFEQQKAFPPRYTRAAELFGPGTKKELQEKWKPHRWEIENRGEQGDTMAAKSAVDWFRKHPLGIDQVAVAASLAPIVEGGGGVGIRRGEEDGKRDMAKEKKVKTEGQDDEEEEQHQGEEEQEQNVENQREQQQHERQEQQQQQERQQNVKRKERYVDKVARSLDRKQQEQEQQEQQEQQQDFSFLKIIPTNHKQLLICHGRFKKWLTAVLWMLSSVTFGLFVRLMLAVPVKRKAQKKLADKLILGGVTGAKKQWGFARLVPRIFYADDGVLKGS